MKKVIALTLALMMCMLLVACAGISDLFGGGSNNGPATPPADPPRTLWEKTVYLSVCGDLYAP